MYQIPNSKKTSNFDQTVEKLWSISTPYLSPKEVALILGKDKKTVLDLCRSGKILGIEKPYGNTVTYQITPKAVEMYLQTSQKLDEIKLSKKQIEDYGPYIKGWKKAMEAGLMTGRGFSHHTVRQYVSLIEKYVAKYKSLSIQNIRTELTLIPPESYSKKSKFHRAVVSFTKYLVREEAIEPKLLEQVTEKSLYPKRIRPPKQHVVSEEHLEILLSACPCPMTRALVILLATTGMRADECAQLNLQDINFETQEVVIRRGKGGKSRTLGLNDATIEALKEYLRYRPTVKTNSLFLSRFKDRIRRDCI